MNAQEARKLSLENSKPETDKILSLIKAAVQLGEVQIQVDKGLKPGTRIWLKENGYKYDLKQGHDKATISW